MAFLREYPPRKQLGPDAGYLGLSIVNLVHSYSLQLLFIIKRSSEFMIIYFSATLFFQHYITLFFQLSQALETVLTPSCYDVTTS